MAIRGHYMRALSRVNRSQGKARRRWRSYASRLRKRMIAANKRHPEDTRRQRSYKGLKPPDKFQKFLRAAGPKALKKFRQFWGVPYPGKIQAVQHGKGKKKQILVGMGHSPFVVLADGPKGHETKIWKEGKRKIVATDPSGKRIYVVDPKLKGPVGKDLRFVGYAPETHYVPFKSVERGGSFKKGKWWIHKHDDEHGKWPKVYRDSSGNYVYGRGTYRIGRWIRR